MKKSKSATIDTRKRIVAAATRMFLEHGLAETGIASIMAAAGLTQGGFYRHFRSKEHLIVEASIAANDRLRGFFSEAIRGKPAAEGLDIAVDLYLSQSEQQGCESLCPLPSLGSELGRSDQQVREAAMAGYQRLVQFFAGLADQAGYTEPARLADAIVSTMVGAVMLARLAASPASAAGVLRNARQTIRLMLPVPGAEGNAKMA